MKTIIGLVPWVLGSLLAGWVGSRFVPGPWYATLAKPSWTPPSWIFGPVWTILYILMGVAAWLVWRRAGLAGAPAALGLFVLQLGLNALWSYLFFGRHDPRAAFLEILLLWGAILATLLAFWRVRPGAGALLVPYLCWVSFAAALNLQVWRLNTAGPAPARLGGGSAEARATPGIDRRTRAMEPVDLYKTLYQAYLGPAHAVPSLEAAREGLTRERGSLRPEGCGEPRIEPLPGPHGLVRVHLRAWPAEEDEGLLRAFAETARSFEPDRSGFVRALEAAAPEEGRHAFTADEWRAYVAARRAEGYPAVHHSEGYRAACAPAYRVVRGELLEDERSSPPRSLPM